MTSRIHLITDTSPAAPGTAAGDVVSGLDKYDSLVITATLTGATGGVLDVYLQYSPDQGTTWIDYAHYAQLTAGAAAVIKNIAVSRVAQQLTSTTVGSGTTPALAANTFLGGDWGDRLRALYVAGASTSAGAAQVIRITGTDRRL